MTDPLADEGARPCAQLPNPVAPSEPRRGRAETVDGAAIAAGVAER